LTIEKKPVKKYKKEPPEIIIFAVTFYNGCQGKDGFTFLIFTVVFPIDMLNKNIIFYLEKNCFEIDT